MELLLSGVILYIASACLFFLKIFLGLRVGPLPTATLLGGMVSYVAYFVSTYASTGRIPVGDPYGMVSFMGNLMILIFLITNALTKKNLGDFGFIVALIGFFTTLVGIPAKRVGYPNPFYVYHIVCAGVAYASLLMSGLSSAVKIIVEKKLRSKHIGGFMIPVSLLRRTERVLLNVGFVSLTLTLLFGSLWAKAFFGKHWVNDPKLLLTMALWLYYAFVVHLNLIRSITPFRFSVLSSIGALMVVISIVFIRHSVS